MKKIAIIGASYLQLPLIEKAKSMGIETHVFAWAANDVGEREADFFYPISIIEKEAILEQCRKIRVDGVCSIASDLASITVNYVADKLGLVCNSQECVQLSTNKHNMREAFKNNGDPSPKSICIETVEELENMVLELPLIVKPLDRSGSRGITKIEEMEQLFCAVETAKEQGFEKKVLIEEFVPGNEYSVECISWKGKHKFLAVTKKYTTGNPNFIETGHMEPAGISSEMEEKIKEVVFHALDSLHIEYGASHSEVKIDNDGRIKIIEIGGRMGGDCIGSSLVYLSTGFDFVKAVIEISLGIEPDLSTEIECRRCAVIRFVFDEKDIAVLDMIKLRHPEFIVEESIKEIGTHKVIDSSTRFGYYILCADSHDDLRQYLPK